MYTYIRRGPSLEDFGSRSHAFMHIGVEIPQTSTSAGVVDTNTLRVQVSNTEYIPKIIMTVPNIEAIYNP